MEEARVLVLGWFSLKGQHATIGDFLSLQVVCDALSSAEIPFDVCHSHEDIGRNYALKVWVTGPVDRSYPPQNALIGNGKEWILTSTTLITDKIGVGAADVSTARDGVGIQTRADLAFLSPTNVRGGYAAILLRGMQPEYRMIEEMSDRIHEAVRTAVIDDGYWPAEISTRVGVDGSVTELSAGLERLLSGAGLVITSRLHGIMHSLRAGKIPIVIDEVPGGGKVSAFSQKFKLPFLLQASECSAESVRAAMNKASGSNIILSNELLADAKKSARNNLDQLIETIHSRIRSIR